MTCTSSVKARCSAAPLSNAAVMVVSVLEGLVRVISTSLSPGLQRVRSAAQKGSQSRSLAHIDHGVELHLGARSQLQASLPGRRQMNHPRCAAVFCDDDGSEIVGLERQRRAQTQSTCKAGVGVQAPSTRTGRIRRSNDRNHSYAEHPTLVDAFATRKFQGPIRNCAARDMVRRGSNRWPVEGLGTCFAFPPMGLAHGGGHGRCENSRSLFC